MHLLQGNVYCCWHIGWLYRKAMFDIISQWETNEWTAIKQTPLASIRLITILYVLLFIVCLFMFIYKPTNKWHFYIFEVNFPMNGVEAHSKFPYGLHSIDSTVHSIERRSINKLDNLLCRLSLARSIVGEYVGIHSFLLSGTFVRGLSLLRRKM